MFSGNSGLDEGEKSGEMRVFSSSVDRLPGFFSGKKSIDKTGSFFCGFHKASQ